MSNQEVFARQTLCKLFRFIRWRKMRISNKLPWYHIRKYNCVGWRQLSNTLNYRIIMETDTIGDALYLHWHLHLHTHTLNRMKKRKQLIVVVSNLQQRLRQKWFNFTIFFNFWHICSLHFAYAHSHHYTCNWCRFSTYTHILSITAKFQSSLKWKKKRLAHFLWVKLSHKMDKCQSNSKNKTKRTYQCSHWNHFDTKLLAMVFFSLRQKIFLYQ